jgi:hypothetical protein
MGIKVDLIYGGILILTFVTIKVPSSCSQIAIN